MENVEFRRGDLEDLPLPNASVDVAISNCVGPVVRAEPAVLREAFRVLKPGGRLVTTGTFIADDTPNEAVREMTASGGVPAKESKYIAKFHAAGFTSVGFVRRMSKESYRTKVMVVARKAVWC